MQYGILVYQTGQDEHKIDVPVSWLLQSVSWFIALQRPSSVGIRPVEYLIERYSADGYTLTQGNYCRLSFKTIQSAPASNVRTRQSVGVQTEVLHCRAEAKFRGDVACAARRAYSEVGILVYQTAQDEHKIDVPVSWLPLR